MCGGLSGARAPGWPIHRATRDRSVSFHQVHTCGGRIRYRKFCERERREVPPTEISSAYEYAGRLVTMTDPRQPPAHQHPPPGSPAVRARQRHRSRGRRPRLLHPPRATGRTRPPPRARGVPTGVLLGGLTGGLAVGLTTPTLNLTLVQMIWRLRGHRVRFIPLLQTALHKQILRQAGTVYQFRHAALQDFLQTLHTAERPATSSTRRPRTAQPDLMPARPGGRRSRRR
ncbi:Ku protein [Saccharopolyspora shandongensis]|uniref:Ku protein n=1 Tax=Saccharopolyspora shandongensis TaxID=418495 RepID=UPI0033E797EF